MSNIPTNVIPIGGISDPSLAGFDPNNPMGRSGALPLSPTGIQAATPSPTAQPTATPSPNLQDELATIQALRASTPSGGAGESIGGVLGGGAGAILSGGNPLVASASASAGKAVGSIVDHMINSKAEKRAEAKELKARRARIQKEKLKANARSISANKERLKGIRTSIEDEKVSDKERLAQERQRQLDDMMSSLQNKAQFNDFIRNKFLASRSI